VTAPLSTPLAAHVAADPFAPQLELVVARLILPDVHDESPTAVVEGASQNGQRFGSFHWEVVPAGEAWLDTP
jgi:hypothetical protein